MAAALAGLQTGRRLAASEIDGGLILRIPRNATLDAVTAVVRAAGAHLGKGVVGLGFDCDLTSGRLTMVKAVLSKEDPKGSIPITGSASADPTLAGVSLAAAVRVLRARRVSGAAAALLADPKLLQACAAARTAAEVSLSEDVFGAGAAGDFAAHPGPELARRGVPVALCCGSWLLAGAEHRPVDAAGELTGLVVHCGVP